MKSKLSSDELQALLHDLMPTKYTAPIPIITATTQPYILNDDDDFEIGADGIPTYYYKSKYVKGKAADILLNFTDKNQLIEKITTGLGATTCLMDQNQISVIIISPNVRQITGKEEQKHKYKADNKFYRYNECTDKWSDVELCVDAGFQFILNCTPDQLMNLKEINNKLYEKLKYINLFIDENQQIILDSSYRSVMEQLYLEINTKWKASYKLSTATSCPHYIDIPEEVEIIRIGKKDTTIKHGLYSTNKDSFKNFLEEQLALDRLTIIFTNDSTIYNYVGTNFQDISFHCASDTLDIKIRKYFHNYDEKKSLTDIINEDRHRIIVMSNAMFAGVDIVTDRECSVIFIADGTKEHCNFNLMDFKQALGRPRNGVSDFLLINVGLMKSNQIMSGKYPKPYNPPTTQAMLQRELKRFFNKDGFQVKCDKIKLHNEFNMFNDTQRNIELLKYKIVVEPYITSRKIKRKCKMSFNRTMLNILNNPLEVLKKIIEKDIRYNLFGVSGGNFDEGHALFYYTAYIIKKYNNERLNLLLNNSELKKQNLYLIVLKSLMIHRKSEFYTWGSHLNYNVGVYDFIINSTNLFGLEFVEQRPSEEEIQDYLLLYWSVYYEDLFSPSEYRRELKIEVIFHEKVELYNMFIDKKNKNYIERATLWMEDKLKDYTLNDYEKERMKSKIDETFKSFKKQLKDYETIKKTVPNATMETVKNDFKYEFLIGNIKKSCLVLFSHGIGTMTKEKRHRLYNPLINLPSFLRKFLPIRIENIDIVSAFPTFIRMIYSREFKLPYIPVYENIMNYYKVDIKKAKILYNMYLNYETNDYDSTLFFFKNAAKYPIAMARKLTEWITMSKKGEVYDVLCKMEEEAIIELIDNNVFYTQITYKYWQRFHDSVIIRSYLIMEKDENSIDDAFPLRPKMELEVEINTLKYAHKPFNYGKIGVKKTYENIKKR